MSIFSSWPEYAPDIDLEITTVAGGSLTIGGNSELLNHSQYSWSPDEVHGKLYKNNEYETDLDIDSSDGSISLASAVSLSQGDTLEFRFQFVGHMSTPWYSKVMMRRSAFVTVPSGTTNYTFDGSTNAMPIPTMDIAFGWDTNDAFKVGVKVTDDDSASEDATLYTRMIGSGPAQQSSSTIDLDSTSTQTHTSSFDKSDIQVGCEAEFYLQSSTGNTRQEDRFRLVILALDEVGSYPTNFPTSDVMLEQVKPSGMSGARWQRPT